MSIYFTSYAAGPKCWTRSLSRLKGEVLNGIPGAGFIDSDEQAISDLLREVNINYEDFWKSNPKGHGLWIWKPALILCAMDKLKHGDMIFYLDAGCSINNSEEALDRFEDYKSLILQKNFLFFHLNHREVEWSKRQLLESIPLGEHERNSGQVMATFFGARITEATKLFFREWLALASAEQGFLLRDPTSSEIQLPFFRAHRHDQSVMSCLVKKQGLESLPDETYFEPNWKQAGISYPIWATRKCSAVDKKFGFGRVSNLVSAVDRKISTFMHQQTIEGRISPQSQQRP